VWAGACHQIGALDVADRIRERTEDSRSPGRSTRAATVSVGVAALKPGHQNVSSLSSMPNRVQAHASGRQLRPAPRSILAVRRIGLRGDNQARPL